MNTITGATARLWAGVVLLVALIVAYVVLRDQAEATLAPVFSLASSAVLWLILGSKMDLLTAGQDQTLAKHTVALATITAQTNGVLTGRIQDAVHTALESRGIGMTVPPETVSALTTQVAAAVITPPPVPTPDPTPAPAPVVGSGLDVGALAAQVAAILAVNVPPVAPEPAPVVAPVAPVVPLAVPVLIGQPPA